MHFSTIKRGFTKQKFFWKNLSFGFNRAFWIYMNEVNPTRKVFTKKIDLLTDFAEKFFKPVVDKYKGKEVEIQEYKGKIPVWIFWLQGKESRPELVELCHKSLEKYLPKDKTEIKFITKDNYREYMEGCPEIIFKKFEKKKITVQAFSDILRFFLLSKYGGMWIDSTVLVTGDITEEILNSKLYILKIYDENKYPKEPSRAIWNMFIWCAKPNNLLFLFARDCLVYYWTKYNKIIDYVLPDYVIKTAYNNFDFVKQEIDEQKPNIHDVWYTLQNINEVYSEELFKKICENTQFHKLTYRWNLKEEVDGKQTVYGYLKSVFLNNKS